jgi:hypothetical protein
MFVARALSMSRFESRDPRSKWLAPILGRVELSMNPLIGGENFRPWDGCPICHSILRHCGINAETQGQIIVFVRSDSIAAWMEHSKRYSCESFTAGLWVRDIEILPAALHNAKKLRDAACGLSGFCTTSLILHAIQYNDSNGAPRKPGTVCSRNHINTVSIDKFLKKKWLFILYDQVHGSSRGTWPHLGWRKPDTSPFIRSSCHPSLHPCDTSLPDSGL